MHFCLIASMGEHSQLMELKVVDDSYLVCICTECSGGPPNTVCFYCQANCAECAGGEAELPADCVPARGQHPQQERPRVSAGQARRQAGALPSHLQICS
jgi:hypothetical protein